MVTYIERADILQRLDVNICRMTRRGKISNLHWAKSWYPWLRLIVQRGQDDSRYTQGYRGRGNIPSTLVRFSAHQTCRVWKRQKPSAMADPNVSRRMRMKSWTDGISSETRFLDCSTWDIIHFCTPWTNLKSKCKSTPETCGGWERVYTSCMQKVSLSLGIASIYCQCIIYWWDCCTRKNRWFRKTYSYNIAAYGYLGQGSSGFNRTFIEMSTARWKPSGLPFNSPSSVRSSN